MKDKRPLKRGLFNKEAMTVKFGGLHSKPEFIFTAKAIHCKPYKTGKWEREDAGGGWYGEKVYVEYLADRNYLVVKDGLCIGIMYNPYVLDIKSELHPIDENTPREVRTFFNSLKLPYQHYISNKVPLMPKEQEGKRSVATKSLKDKNDG